MMKKEEKSASRGIRFGSKYDNNQRKRKKKLHKVPWGVYILVVKKNWDEVGLGVSKLANKIRNLNT